MEKKTGLASQTRKEMIVGVALLILYFTWPIMTVLTPLREMFERSGDLWFWSWVGVGMGGIGFITIALHIKGTKLLKLIGILVVLIISTVTFGLIGVFAVHEIVMHPQAKARQSEAKVGLGGIYTTATAMFAERKTFLISDISQLGYAPSGHPLSRYTFWYAVNGVPTRMNVVSPDLVRGCDGPPTFVKVAASATGFTVAARGNIDSDPTCDEWSINDARVLTNTINDVAQ